MDVSCSRKSLLFTAICVTLAACVDAPTESADVASPENQLAVSFDDLSAEQFAVGDLERGEEFRWAALGMRLGVVPTRFELTNDGQTEVYDAFVQAVKWSSLQQASRPLSHRTLVAWRRTPEKMQVLLVGSHLAEAPVVHPYSMRMDPGTTAQTSPIAGAHAAFFERAANGKAWIGTSGQVKMEVESSGGGCNALPNEDVDGVTCQRARYEVRFDIRFTPTRGNTRELDVAAITKRLVAREQDVAGVTLTFSCQLPTSAGGCRQARDVGPGPG
jgi:hypothetical protein